MYISGLQHSMQSYAASESITKQILRKNGISASLTGKSQTPSSNSKSKSVAQNNINSKRVTQNSDPSMQNASPSEILGKCGTMYQWEIKELSTLRDQLLSGAVDLDPSTPKMPTSPSNSGNFTIVDDSGVKLDTTAPEVIFQLGPSKHTQDPNPVQDFIDNVITGFASAFTSSWLSQESPAVTEKVQNITNQSMGQNYDWTNVSSEGLGLSDVGTNADEIVSKINQAISTLNGYYGAISTVLGKNSLDVKA